MLYCFVARGARAELSTTTGFLTQNHSPATEALCTFISSKMAMLALPQVSLIFVSIYICFVMTLFHVCRNCLYYNSPFEKKAFIYFSFHAYLYGLPASFRQLINF